MRLFCWEAGRLGVGRLGFLDAGVEAGRIGSGEARMLGGERLGGWRLGDSAYLIFRGILPRLCN